MRPSGQGWFGKDEAEHAQTNPAPRDHFYDWAATLGADARVLEIGTRQSEIGTPTHRHHRFPGVSRERYVMADVQDGEDVDCVADLHVLPGDWTGRFDAVVAIAVFEHLERPWIAAREIERVLKPDGRCYIATHQTFPLHGYPSDYFRFSREALRLIFEDAGILVQDVGYEQRTFIGLPGALVPKGRLKRRYVRIWNRAHPSFIIVHLHGRKIAS